MNSVMMSIRPTWAQLIDKGIKTVEVRKTFPDYHRTSCPFKVYLYCTQGKPTLTTIIHNGDDLYGYIYHGKKIFVKHPEGGYGSRVKRGTVFGEFVCDCAESLNELFEDDPLYHRPYYGECCLTREDLEQYGMGKRLWGWHISDYKFYDKPKNLEDFGLKKPPQSWCYIYSE